MQLRAPTVDQGASTTMVSQFDLLNTHVHAHVLSPCSHKNLLNRSIPRNDALMDCHAVRPHPKFTQENAVTDAVTPKLLTCGLEESRHVRRVTRGFFYILKPRQGCVQAKLNSLLKTPALVGVCSQHNAAANCRPDLNQHPGVIKRGGPAGNDALFWVWITVVVSQVGVR